MPARGAWLHADLGDRCQADSTRAPYRCCAAWADVPERYGPSGTLYNRFVRWRAKGIWDQLFEAVSKAYDSDIVMIDSSCVRVHQHGATAKKGALEIIAWDVRAAA